VRFTVDTACGSTEQAKKLRFHRFTQRSRVWGRSRSRTNGLGVTPIVADYAGPSELVDEKTGIRIPFDDKDSLAQGMRLAIGSILRAPERLDSLGVAAREKSAPEFHLGSEGKPDHCCPRRRTGRHDEAAILWFLLTTKN